VSNVSAEQRAPGGCVYHVSSILLTPEMSSGMCLCRSRRCRQQGCICHESLICG